MSFDIAFSLWMAAPTCGNWAARKAWNPVYPDSLWKAGTSGQTMVEFVVDSLGRIEMDYLSVISESHLEFGESVRAAHTHRRRRAPPARRPLLTS